ncbi:MAG: DF family (seleno)protein [Nitrospiria bacterium]
MIEKPIKIEFLYWEDCPSHRDAWNRLQVILKEKGVEAKVVRVEIRTDQNARQWDFCGSPTIRINGMDIDPAGVEGQRVGLNCRIYHTPDGRVTPMPPDEMIRKAIEKALK